MADLALTSRLTSLTLEFDPIHNAVYSIRWALDDNDDSQGSVNLNNGTFPESGRDDYTNLGKTSTHHLMGFGTQMVRQ